MKLIESSYRLFRRKMDRKQPLEIKFIYKTIDFGHNHFIPDSNIIRNTISQMQKKDFLFLQIITGFNQGTILRNRAIDVVDDLYVNKQIDFYFCPGDMSLTRKELTRDHDWFKQLLPINIGENKGCICVFFLSSSKLKDCYPALLNSDTIYTSYTSD